MCLNSLIKHPTGSYATKPARGTIPVIPGKKNRKIEVEYDSYIYKERNAVERFFNRIKHFRRIATRYDKTAIMFLGGLMLASILLWIKF